MTPSYDDRQVSAVLVTCALCRRSFYMTKPEKFCLPCSGGNRPMRERLLGPERIVDVSGVVMYDP